MASKMSFFTWVSTLIYYSATLDKLSIWETVSPYIAIATNPFRDKQSQLEIVDGDWKIVIVTTIV